MNAPSLSNAAAPDWPVVTATDRARLHRWLKRLPAEALAAELMDLIDSADEVAPQDVPADVVTMNSQVVLGQAPGEGERRLTLCYPPDADVAAGRVSVLSPVGMALLGRRQGDAVELTGPDGQRDTLRILGVVFQPEADGQYTL